MDEKELARAIAAEIGADVVRETEKQLENDGRDPEKQSERDLRQSEDQIFELFGGKISREALQKNMSLSWVGPSEAMSIASLIIGGTSFALQMYDRVKGRKTLIETLEKEIGERRGISKETRHNIIKRIADKVVEQD